jgi:deferrochelatase/peroxidase EfeB
VIGPLKLMTSRSQPSSARPRRAQFLDAASSVPASAGLVGVAAGAAAGFALEGQENPPAAGSHTYPFYGQHQAGILTPAQDRLHFAAFDVITNSREELVQLLKDWTAAAARMTQGLAAGELGPTAGPWGAPRTTPAKPSDYLQRA